MEKLCVVCKKRKAKWFTQNLGSYNYGFCSKVCIANLCVVCKKRKAKWFTQNLGSYNYGFCSKVCIANHTIAHYKLTKKE